MNLRKRVTGIITTPRQEWAIVAAEPADVAGLVTQYVMVLALIPAVGLFIGLGLFSPVGALAAAVGQYVYAILGTIVGAAVIERLAPRFRSSGSLVDALKLVAYASTPVWLAGVFYVVILLSPLVILAALYAVYLFYLGLPIVLKTPYDQVIPFMVVAAIVVVVVNIVLRLMLQMIGI